MDVPVHGGSKVEDSLKRFEAHSGRSRFVVVDAVALSKSFCNIPDFVVYNLSSVVAFALAYEFAFERALAAG